MMPDVTRCTVSECFYNKDMLCHAEAILVGSSCPQCDTFIESGEHGFPAPKGKVGACHESDCQYNEELSCHADGIDVAHHGEHADCITYSPY